MIQSISPAGPSLLVFSDDWGRHPSSCQHLVHRLLLRYSVCWVNTIGTRAPRLDAATLRRAVEKVRHWSRPRHFGGVLPRNLRVVNPRMWPYFTRRHDRALNRRLLASQLVPVVQSLPQPVTAVTTLPITADLVGRLPVERWVYYCVDDFGSWPGLDGRTLRRMDDEMIRSADEVIAVSGPLAARAADLGREAKLLTHGVDLDFWRAAPSPEGDRRLAGCEPPLFLFWGVVDRRMDVEWVRGLAAALTQGTIVLVGPRADLDPDLLRMPRVVHCPAVPLSILPAMAARAAVLVMPYADLPVTRAMQPLKLKEYLATDRPVVVRDLPAVRDWSDCLDAAHTAEEFVRLALRRSVDGMAASQRAARRRLSEESWDAKARAFESMIFARTRDVPWATGPRVVQEFA